MHPPCTTSYVCRWFFFSFALYLCVCIWFLEKATKRNLKKTMTLRPSAQWEVKWHQKSLRLFLWWQIKWGLYFETSEKYKKKENKRVIYKAIKKNHQDLFHGKELLERRMRGDMPLTHSGYINALTISFSHHVFKGMGDWMAHWGFKACFHVPFGSFIVLPFINNGSYFLYYSAAAVLFITACNRCLETGDKHGRTSLCSARRGGCAGGLRSPNQAVCFWFLSAKVNWYWICFFPPLITCFSCKVKLDWLNNTFLLLIFTKPSLTINLLILKCIYIWKII